MVLVLLYLGIMGSGVAQFTWTKALSELPASTCSLFYPLQAVFSAVLGAYLLGESFTVHFYLGLILISADILLNFGTRDGTSFLKSLDERPVFKE